MKLLMVTGYDNPNIDWYFGGHPVIFISLHRNTSIPSGISLPIDMNIPGCPPQPQSLFGSY